jgi:hypothetical protein
LRLIGTEGPTPVRVSTLGQDIAGQVAELQAAGCGNIFKEKASGTRTDRPELAKAIRRLAAAAVRISCMIGCIETREESKGKAYVAMARLCP